MIHTKVSLSLLLCNILVIVTYVYRVFGDPENPSSIADSSWSRSGRINASHVHSRHQREPTKVYTSTQIFTLTEYPTSAPDVTSKERRASVDTVEHSLSSKKQNDLLPPENVWSGVPRILSILCTFRVLLRGCCMYHLYLAESWRRIIVFVVDKDWGRLFRSHLFVVGWWYLELEDTSLHSKSYKMLCSFEVSLHQGYSLECSPIILIVPSN